MHDAARIVDHQLQSNVPHSISHCTLYIAGQLGYGLQATPAQAAARQDSGLAFCDASSACDVPGSADLSMHNNLASTGVQPATPLCTCLCAGKAHAHWWVHDIVSMC